MNEKEIYDLFLEELKMAEKKFPDWPNDKIHAAAIVCEEAGELIQSTLDFEYDKCPRTQMEWDKSDSKYFNRMKNEAIQVGAMAIRFLKNF